MSKRTKDKVGSGNGRGGVRRSGSAGNPRIHPLAFRLRAVGQVVDKQVPITQVGPIVRAVV
ncbi:MAG: hypothetical protein QM767_23835 [Anaeromyxobacter sp.]